MHFKGEVLSVALALATPALVAHEAQASVLNIGNVPGALQAGPGKQGDPTDCAVAVPGSVTTRLTPVKAYSWPNHGKSTLEKAGLGLRFSLEPLLDYVTKPGQESDTSMIKYCLGTRTVKTVVRMQTGNHKKSKHIFDQTIRGNDSGSIVSDVVKPVKKICQAKKHPKNIKFLMTETDSYKDKGVSLKFVTKKSLSIPCVTRDYATATTN